MNRYFAATLFLSLTLALGCQPKTNDVEDGPDSPTVVTPEASSPEEDANQEPPAPAESDSTAVPPTTEPDPASEETPSVDATADTEAGEEDVEDEKESPPTERDFINKLNNASDMQTALEIAEQAQAAFPENPQWVSIRARILGRDGRVEEGWELLDAAYQENPENGQLAPEVLGFVVNFGDRAEGDAKQKLILGGVAVLDAIEAAGQLDSLGRARGIFVERIRLGEAQFRATQGDLEAATRALKAAFAEGFRDVEKIRDDEAFAELLKQEDVAQMVAAREEEIRQEDLAEAQALLDEGESFPFDFALADIAGDPVALKDFVGKVVIVDFWGTWCPPCRMEIPHFIKLQETYTDDLAIVGINYEHGQSDEENIELITEFAESMGIPYPCCLGDEDTKAQIPNLEGFPTTLFLDRTGKVRLTTVGYRPYGKLEAIVNVLREEAPADAEAEGTEGETIAESVEEAAAEPAEEAAAESTEAPAEASEI